MYVRRLFAKLTNFICLEAAYDLNHLQQIDRILGGCM